MASSTREVDAAVKESSRRVISAALTSSCFLLRGHFEVHVVARRSVAALCRRLSNRPYCLPLGLDYDFCFTRMGSDITYLLHYCPRIHLNLCLRGEITLTTLRCRLSVRCVGSRCLRCEERIQSLCLDASSSLLKSLRPYLHRQAPHFRNKRTF